MLWLVVGLGGAREIVLRLPSVIAAAGAALLLYRLGTRLVDREAGLLAATAFACVDRHRRRAGERADLTRPP